ncbi:MAG: hypothetical protein ACJA1H_000657 [Glaciecola sp.]|jgi:hypothetical protein
MKKITLLIFTICAFHSGNAQTNLFFDDFESYTDFIITGIGDWDTLDLDGLPTYTGGDSTFENANAAMAFIIFNPAAAGSTNEDDPAAAEARNFDPFSGVKYAAAWASPPGAVAANDDWLISPPVDLAVSGNSVTFQVKAMSNTYGDENYEVGIYTGTGTPTASSDFDILGGTRTATYPDWAEVTVDLSGYDDTEIRIGIHYTSSDVYMLLVDDFSVDTTLNLSVNDFESNTFTHSYNKDTDILTLDSSTLPFSGVEIYNILGQRVINNTLSVNNETIDISNLKDGIYLIKVSIQGHLQTIKILKQ